MKILLVSMPSIHFFRWAEQFKETEHEIIWFDIVDGGKKVDRLNWLKHYVEWKLKYNYLGRYYVKSRFPKLYSFIQKFNENSTSETFESILKKEKPDIVHSFALYVSCAPILNVMMKYPKLKWVYSSWGSDLYYFQKIPEYLEDIKKVLPRVNYLFTDCERDYKIASKYGFSGEFLGVFPGGGGFNMQKMDKLTTIYSKRKIILVKGYQGRSGRAINVLKAIGDLKNELLNYNIIVFGADPEVIRYVDNSKLANFENLEVHGKMSRDNVLELMGKSLIYIGNSNSDGLPNTLLEAICLDVFPIQSNPGGATEELISNDNGLLINDCESVEEIVLKMKKAVHSPLLIEKAINYNKVFKQSLEQNKIKYEILEKYKNIEELNN